MAKYVHIIAVALVAGIGTFGLMAGEHPTVSMVPPNFKPCAGHCEPQNINCDKNTKEHGSYHWCKENCLSPTKEDVQKYQEGIGSCHAASLSSLEKDLESPSAKP